MSILSLPDDFETGVDPFPPLLADMLVQHYDITSGSPVCVYIHLSCHAGGLPPGDTCRWWLCSPFTTWIAFEPFVYAVNTGFSGILSNAFSKTLLRTFSWHASMVILPGVPGAHFSHVPWLPVNSFNPSNPLTGSTPYPIPGVLPPSSLRLDSLIHHYGSIQVRSAYAQSHTSNTMGDLISNGIGDVCVNIIDKFSSGFVRPYRISWSCKVKSVPIGSAA